MKKGLEYYHVMIACQHANELLSLELLSVISPFSTDMAFAFNSCDVVSFGPMKKSWYTIHLTNCDHSKSNYGGFEM